MANNFNFKEDIPSLSVKLEKPFSLFASENMLVFSYNTRLNMAKVSTITSFDSTQAANEIDNEHLIRKSYCRL
jgi:hypothetical protein